MSPSPPLAVTSQRGEPVWELALLYPPQGEWTEQNYLALRTNRLVELSDGCLEWLPVPTPLHQLIVKFLVNLLEAYVVAHGPGTVLFAPLPVRLGPGRFREPDVVFLSPGRITDPRTQPDGADLVMEVVSAGEENRQRDLVTKREEYARAGVREYWVVDPEERKILVLALQGQDYYVHGEFGPGDRATSVMLPGFSAGVEEVFAAGQVVG